MGLRCVIRRIRLTGEIIAPVTRTRCPLWSSAFMNIYFRLRRDRPETERSFLSELRAGAPVRIAIVLLLTTNAVVV